MRFDDLFNLGTNALQALNSASALIGTLSANYQRVKDTLSIEERGMIEDRLRELQAERHTLSLKFDAMLAAAEKK